MLAGEEWRCCAEEGCPAGGDSVAWTPGPRRGVFPNGCSSGNVTGDPKADRARCVVVALRLSDNALAGTLVAQTGEEHLRALDTLVSLALADNQLTGELPVKSLYAMSRLRRLDLSGNTFAFVEGKYDRLFRRCRSADLACEGVPPESCDVFGKPGDDKSKFQPSIELPDLCVYCAQHHVPEEAAPVHSRTIPAALAQAKIA